MLTLLKQTKLLEQTIYSLLLYGIDKQNILDQMFYLNPIVELLLT